MIADTETEKPLHMVCAGVRAGCERLAGSVTKSTSSWGEPMVQHTDERNQRNDCLWEEQVQRSMVDE